MHLLVMLENCFCSPLYTQKSVKLEAPPLLLLTLCGVLCAVEAGSCRETRIIE